MAIAETIQPDWQDADIQSLSGGLNTNLSEEAIQNTELTEALNVNITRNLVVGDLGYYPYKFVDLTLDGDYVAGNTVLDTLGSGHLDSKAGSSVAIVLDDGSIFTTTIATITAPTVTITDPLPSDASDGNSIRLARYIIGIPLKFHKLELAAGSSVYFMATTKTLYRDNSLGYWEPIPYDTPAATAVNVAINPGDTVFTIDDTTGFTVGDIVRIARASGRYYTGQITAIGAGAPGTITCANEKFGIGTAIGATVEKCVTMTGDVDDKISMVSIPWADQMVMTNGVDPIIYYDNTSDITTLVTGLPAAGNTLAKSLAVFDSSLILFSTVEGGTYYRQRIRYCDIADITEWVLRDAGAIDLLDTTKECLAGKILGPYLYVYRSKGIHRISRSQRGDRRFDADEMITNHGILSPDCVQEISENLHALFDDENIFLYDGGFSVDPVGDRIKRDIFGPTGKLDVTTAGKSALLYLTELKALFVAFEPATDTGPVLAYRYSIEEKAWTTRLFPLPIYAMGRGNQVSAITWETVQGTWSASDYSWDSAFVGAQADSLLLGLGTSPNANSFVYQQVYHTDAGIPIPYLIRTKNFTEDYRVRFDWIDVWCSGGEIIVEYSTDRGASWSNYGIINATSEVARYRLHRQFIAYEYMFKISSSDPNFSILKLRARIAPETEQ